MREIQNNFWQKIFNLNTIFLVLVIISVLANVQEYLLQEYNFTGEFRPHYNNYLIFKYSFQHLIDGLNLYDSYTDEYSDLFKYSPTFALFMGSFYFLPDWLGLFGWNFLNVLVLFIGIRLIPTIQEKTKVFILLFVLFELIGNMQNEQSNTLMAGLMVLSFGFFEKKKLWIAALVIAISVYIKLFGIVACALFLLYPNKFRFVAFFIFWMIALWALPLVFINPDELINQYINWVHLLKADHAHRYGFSILGVLQQWFHLEPSKWIILLIGVVLFCSVYIRKDLFKDYGFRLLMLASILIWVIIFNHAAESSGYVICMTGAGIWYFIQERNRLNTLLIIAAFIMISLIYSDITPIYYRQTYLHPYYVKTIPAIIIWLRIIYEMLFKKYHLKAMN